jgi:hypothetical protein
MKYSLGLQSHNMCRCMSFLQNQWNKQKILLPSIISHTADGHVPSCLVVEQGETVVFMTNIKR